MTNKHDCWWTIKESDKNDNAIIYTTNKNKLKTNIEPMAEYYHGKNNKIVAKQYKVGINSEEFKRIMNELKLTEKDRIVEKRKSKK